MGVIQLEAPGSHKGLFLMKTGIAVTEAVKAWVQARYKHHHHQPKQSNTCFSEDVVELLSVCLAFDGRIRVYGSRVLKIGLPY